MPFTRTQIIDMLSLQGSAMQELLSEAVRVCHNNAGGIYLRGLIEYSNRCRKNCLYCGIRSEMSGIQRYALAEKEVLNAARYALEQGYGSVVLQAGEISSPEYVSTIENLIRQIKQLRLTEPKEGWAESLGITLSLGEQSLDTYRRWRQAGASRYLLRIESSDRNMYSKIHPNDVVHSYDNRLKALHNIREAGLQLGTGVMIGVPGQSMENLGDDLLFMRSMDIDMCGMGPYVESSGTPMAGMELQGAQWRVEMTLKMIAVLRLMMPDINIAAATALDALDPHGRQKALKAGANVLMPNITPVVARSQYQLYEGKPFGDGLIDGLCVQWGVHGDPLHFKGKPRL